ncbi:MAG: tRNA (adenosine(37)-N6)-dimethylallyltransferase MiaA [Bacilli bacterium]|nr:tRNA (adenosine(37)-N6)-dimethylallyltransferase MiaA [Bacilli bacterium]
MIYIICGPTGSGKTSAAIKVANALSCPIINADAFQIYKGMDIGTAKIIKDDPNYNKHYLLDIVSPDASYSVKEYQEAFRKTVSSLSKNYQDIVVCGGTGLYIRASIYDYNFEEHEPDDTSDLEKLTNDELWNMLISLDKDACNNIHPNNRKRVIRAISIARTNTISKSQNIEMQSHKLIYDDVRILMLNPPRDLLYENINKRVDIMFENGLINEVESLTKQYELSLTAKQAIGYKEVLDYLDGNCSLESAKELIKQRTRNYAKRQVTFFKHQFELETFETKELLLKELGIYE